TGCSNGSAAATGATWPATEARPAGKGLRSSVVAASFQLAGPGKLETRRHGGRRAGEPGPGTRQGLLRGRVGDDDDHPRLGVEVRQQVGVDVLAPATAR